MLSIIVYAGGGLLLLGIVAFVMMRFRAGPDADSVPQHVLTRINAEYTDRY